MAATSTMDGYLAKGINLLTFDEEVAGLVVEEVEVVVQDKGFCLVGRFLMEKGINFNAMKQTMANLWHPGKGEYSGDWGFSVYVPIFPCC